MGEADSEGEEAKSATRQYRHAFDACEARLLQLRTELAHEIQGPFLGFVRLLPQGSSNEMRETAQLINSDLRKLGLAFRCPNTGKPTDLAVDRSTETGRPRFRLVLMDVVGHRT